MAGLLAEMRGVAATLDGSEYADIGVALVRGVEALEQAGEWLKGNLDEAGENAGAAAYNFLMLAGTVAGGWQMAVAAVAALRRLVNAGENADFLRAKLITARFYAEQIMPRAQAHRDAAMAGSRTMMALDEAHFGL